jgi:hypothetical protein
MSDFDAARKEYASARTEVESIRLEMLQALEKVRRLEREAAEQARRSVPEDTAHASATVTGAQSPLDIAKRNLATKRRQFADSRAAALAGNERFSAFTDPRIAVQRMPDDTPIAFFPLRLETRFKTVSRNGANQLFLLVRAFPDDLLIDSFQPQISQTEYENAVTYWTQRWAAAGNKSGHRAAWALLVRAHGAGRARWLIEQIKPLNPDDEPGDPADAYVLELPDEGSLSISQEAWTRAAHTWLLPERLVLLGFHGTKKVLDRLGEPIPPELQIGPDPAADDDDQIKADAPDLEIPEALQWTVDFDEAVSNGMGFRVNLTELGVMPPFSRLFVLGVRVGSDSSEGADELSKLIGHHQASRKGFSLLPQGRPTNNTDASVSGHSWWENPDESFRHYFETDPADDPGEWKRRKDGAWLAGLLGVSPSLLRSSPNYFCVDQAQARAMNIALWPATLGYYMEQMLEPVFDEETALDTREFFNRFVIGRGTLPCVRIGRQPYGILPATVWSRMGWWKDAAYSRNASTLDLPGSPYLKRLFTLADRASAIWKQLSHNVSNVGDPGPEPQQTLLDILGLHPTSAEFYQRYSQSFTQHYNALGFEIGLASAPLSAKAKAYVDAALLALAELGWTMPADSPLPELLEKIFLKKPNLLKGELVQVDQSDTIPLTVTRADNRNYVDWLQWAARASHDTLRKQEGFTNGPPRALLYLMLHHALDLGFIDADLTFRRDALQLTELEFRTQRKEPKFIHVANDDHRSRWENLYRAEPAVTNDPALRMGDYIPTVLLTRRPYLNDQLSALDVLKTATAGALERALVEHLDCLTYRLDAWRMGLHAVQLAYMRQESDQGFGKAGIYTGAYGWLENVNQKSENLESVPLDDDLAEIFNEDDAPPLMHDPASYGHIHAPSLDQAVTAAILRNGHLANATPQAPDLLAVDLSSERVRWAQQIIEGIRNGQSLGALLGYRLERSLHDEPAVYLDELIYKLRAAFPLAGNKNETTKKAVDDIETVEARNVVDGSAFVDHIAETGVTTYPYDVALPPLSDLVQPGSPSASEIGLLVDKCVADMRRVADSVADLAIAEGVYQLVRGNYDRAAGTMDAFSKGTHPPLPEVVSTPRGGRSLTHRIALHMEGGLLPSDPDNTRPRSKGEPALARWLGDQLPDPAQIFARVTWHNEAAGSDGSITVSMADLGLAPVDLFYMLDAGGARDMPGFDDLLIDFADRNGSPRPRHDATFTLEYKPDGISGFTLFETAPLVRAVRGLILGARPLRPTDLSLQNEAASGDDAALVIRTDKAQAVIADLQTRLPAIQTLITNLATALDDSIDVEIRRDSARDNIDAWLDAYATAVRPAISFGLQSASLMAGVEGRRVRFSNLIASIDETIERWEKKQVEYDDLLNAYGTLPGTATVEERTSFLISAARAVSAAVIAPLPLTITDLESAVALLRATFDTQLTNLVSLRDAAKQVGATLKALTAFAPTMQSLDLTPVDLTSLRDSVLALAGDLLQKAIFLRDDIGTRVKNANDALTRAAALSGDKAQSATADAAKEILGDAFILLPEFSLSIDQLAEWQNVWSNRSNLTAHLETGVEATPFPVDDWLHGAARVRERLRHLEMTIILSETLGAADPAKLDVLQFPFKVNDSWLGLRFPATFPDGKPFTLDADKLLYSAIVPSDGEIDTADPSRTYCALMLDEWVEVIPTDSAATGLSFHFNRPNAEAPQAILLATPPEHHGAWKWGDLVDTLHETLDFARMRAVEPHQLDATPLATLIPAILSSVTTFPITASLNFSFNNEVHAAMLEATP